MKRFISTIFLLSLALAAIGQSIRFDSTTHNFGTIEESGGKVAHTFHYTNSGTQQLVIIDVAVSCGCTTPRFSRNPLAVGATGKLTIEFDPINRPGRINKEIYVVTNAGNLKLTIDGIVNPRPRSLEERYPFIVGSGARIDGLGHYSLQVPINDAITTEIGIANTSPAIPVTIGFGYSTLPSNVTVTASKTLVGARDEARLSITVRGDKYGAFNYSIPLIINGKKTAESLAIAGAVIDNFALLSDEELVDSPRAKFSTFYHRFGTVKTGAHAKTIVEITNIGRSPLIIRGIEGSTQIEAKIDRTTIAPNGTANLTLIYTPSQTGYDSGSVRLVVNDPRNPTPEIRFTAAVEGGSARQ